MGVITMEAYRNNFKACRVVYTTYLRWNTKSKAIREYHLHVEKMRLELARALFNVERRRVNA